ncbi:hypothetical protein C2U70_00110 [Bradyrhizobium guangdongense]|uniref:hypothetical protein n=1 Tax=Bradyrhizobium guangdongense TaxID=1325090 RepID=UPI00112D65F1|nr:hypothetical protein [Bradyrhizobium guangdongense]TPQ43061.1 hypothetical protein C2U70_00110 [Bradyrhizobium guangdongense]
MIDTPNPAPAEEPVQADLAAPEPPPPASGFAKRVEALFDLFPFFGTVFIVILLVDPVRNFLWDSRQVTIPVVTLVAVVVLMILLMPIGQRWLKESKASTRAAFFIFFLLVLVSIVAIVASLGQLYQYTVLRGVFLAVVCLLPGAMWYLFVGTRKASLLNEYLVNLDHLGLLRQLRNEDAAIRGRRVQSYLQKFEAIYGELAPNVYADVLNGHLGKYSRADTGGVTTLSTATVPVLLATVLISLGWLVTLPPYQADVAFTNSPGVQALTPSGTPVQLAFLGAYFFSLQMLFRRYVLEDLGGSAYVAISLRIILAVIGIWAFTAVSSANEHLLLLAGFVFGVFPRVLWQVMEQMFKKAAGVILPSMISQLPISDLDGLTVWHEVRLEEEDIENIPNMATADIVELLLNTRLPPERIIDWIDQAILYTQLGPQPKPKEGGNAREKLRTHGIRTASSLLWASAEVQRQGKSERFDRILQGADGASAMPALEASLRTNSNLDLIEQWRGTCNAPQRPAVQSPAEPPALQLPEMRDGEFDPNRAAAAA